MPVLVLHTGAFPFQLWEFSREPTECGPFESLLEKIIEGTRLSGDPGAGPGQLEAPYPAPVLAVRILPTVPTVGAIFKDAALSDQCVVETTWTESS